jgi:hypothetical protein
MLIDELRDIIAPFVKDDPENISPAPFDPVPDTLGHRPARLFSLDDQNNPVHLSRDSKTIR